MQFLSGFDGLGAYRMEPPDSRPVNPAVINQIRPAPQAQIRPATQAQIRPAPQAQIRPAPQAQILPATYQGDTEQAYANIRAFDSVFGQKITSSGLGEDGLPIWREMPESMPITPPTATLPAFRVPGAGMEAKGPLRDMPILPGPTGEIRSYAQEAAQNPDEVLIQRMRDHIQPLLNTLAQVPPAERAAVFKNAMDVLEFPAAPALVEELTMRYIARGTNGQIAFKEALARVLARNLKIAGNIVADTRAARRAPAGLYGLHGFGSADDELDIDDLEGLGGVWSKIKSAGKSVGKWTGKVTKVVGKVTGAVACGAAGATQDPKALAACGAAKAMEKAGSGLESATKGKKKKKKGGDKKEAAAAPQMSATAPSLSTSAPAPAPAPDLAPAPESAAPAAPAEAEAKPGMSMGMKIGIGVAAVAVVGGIVLATRK